MALSSELLGESMQTYEEFRLDVERQIYGESLEDITPGDIPTTPLEEVIFIAPRAHEEREVFPQFSPFTNVINRG